MNAGNHHSNDEQSSHNSHFLTQNLQCLFNGGDPDFKALGIYDVGWEPVNLHLHTHTSRGWSNPQVTFWEVLTHWPHPILQLIISHYFLPAHAPYSIHTAITALLSFYCLLECPSAKALLVWTYADFKCELTLKVLLQLLPSNIHPLSLSWHMHFPNLYPTFCILQRNSGYLRYLHLSGVSQALKLIVCIHQMDTPSLIHPSSLCYSLKQVPHSSQLFPLPILLFL